MRGKDDKDGEIQRQGGRRAYRKKYVSEKTCVEGNDYVRNVKYNDKGKKKNK